MADFSIAIKKTLDWEGGYANHPDDKGGETMFGITISVARANGYNGPMKDLPLDFAKQIYKKNYWDQLCLDHIDDQEIAEKIFDTGVNCGIRKAGQILQNALNLIVKSSDLLVDGVIGDKTMAAYRQAGKKLLLKCYNGLRFEFYHAIIKGNPKQKVFFNGWISRI